MCNQISSVCVLAATVILTGGAIAFAGDGPPPPSKFNILFVILDDVGADQLTLSNPSGVGLAPTPTIDTIAAQGVNFTNAWGMPECSPSRACFFTGRFPSRTGVGSPMTTPTLTRSQCSPFEATTPRILTPAGYASALIGKFHISQEQYNPYELLAPTSNGFTNFNGTLLGAPPYIDPTIAGQVTTGRVRYSCGFPVFDNAPAICACAFPPADGQTAGECLAGVNALECLTAGGVPLVAADGTPIQECDPTAAARIDWDSLNGSYAWPRTVNQDGVASQVTAVRKHADVDQAELAIEFINAQRKEQQQDPSGKWMCTLSFSGDHDPWQPPPPESLPSGTAWPSQLTYACGEQEGVESALLQERLLSNWTIQSLDTQIRRVLIETGLATVEGDTFALTAPDTVIVVVGDNGSFLTSVKAPFNPLRAKATAYQTGICVPLVVAGGPTTAPGRAVNSLVNIVDLYQLWGELAAVDVHAAVPEGRRLDCRSMLPYLTSPATEGLRTWNYSEYFEPHLADVCYPCLISSGSADTCTDTILTSAALCESQGGVWHPEATDCCDLRHQMEEAGESIRNFAVVYAAQRAITDGRWKLVYSEQPECLIADGACDYEFFDLSQCLAAGVLFGHGVDDPQFNLLATCDPEADLNLIQREAYVRMRAKLDVVVASFHSCPGDVTMNGTVNAEDLTVLLGYWGLPSVADLNNDGITNGADLTMMIVDWGWCAP